MFDKSLEDIRSVRFYIALSNECLGTMLLVLVGCGACTSSPLGGLRPDLVSISLVFGFSVGTIVWMTANTSGGHINPAVSFSMMITHKISVVRGILYIVVQCVGAIIGAGILKLLVEDSYPENRALGTSTPGPAVSAPSVFAVELLITFVLLFCVHSTTDGRRTDLDGSGPLAIGLSITMCHLWAVPYTGAGMNPARVLGPAIVSGTWDTHWAYWIGPIAGGLSAGLIYELGLSTTAGLEKTKAFFLPNYALSDFYAPVDEGKPESPKKRKQKATADDVELRSVSVSADQSRDRSRMTTPKADDRKPLVTKDTGVGGAVPQVETTPKSSRTPRATSSRGKQSDRKTGSRSGRVSAKTPTSERTAQSERDGTTTPKEKPRDGTTTPKEKPIDGTATPKQKPRDGTTTPKEKPRDGTTTPKQKPRERKRPDDPKEEEEEESGNPFLRLKDTVKEKLENLKPSNDDDEEK